MKLYHGSQSIIEFPQFGGGKPYNDYGPGFYCTQSLEMAQEWSATPDKPVGYANAYSLDTTDLSVLDLNQKPYTILHWLAILLENRSFMTRHALEDQARKYLISSFEVPYQDYDIIKGNRADDSYFAFAHAFLSGSISLQQLQKTMNLGGLGKQVVLKSEEAFRRITFVEAIEADCSIWLPKRQGRDGKARRDYQRLAQEGFDSRGIFIQDILREEMKPQDARLQ